MSDLEYSKQLMQLEPELYAVARQYLSCYADQQDAVQECLCKAWAGRHSVANPRFFKTWVCRILKNQCVDILRKQRKTFFFVQSETAAERDVLERVIDLDSFHLIMSSAGKDEKEIIELLFNQGYPLKDIAYMTKKPMGTIQSKLYRFLKRARKSVPL